ncbi:signal recognition particle receptor subunit beta-like isoform X2 [Macadamia integrifolia]|uniref:signal recognition particle receptor subunit beta-like isoform X2 n=1 Tax=Macadamia integrifolia TaxID=60698 RepID=UPI001C4F3438|nr:signal recognition particle receptor subunit beta-like isoform X2 [Macadamia integrifolia]
MEGMEKWTNQLQQWLYQVEHWVHQTPASQLYVAIGVLFLTSVILLLFGFFRRTKSNTIVLAGLSGSGKTILFYQKGKINPVHVVDVPGHSRLRPKLDEYLPQTAALIFVVDAVEFLPNCRAAAEYLYDILTKASVVKRKIPVVILCNKTDKVTAHTKEFIRKQLEKEIDKLRTSRNAISDADIANEFTLGVTGEAFTFSHCHNKVTVAEASGLTGDIVQVEQFIREHVKP